MLVARAGARNTKHAPPIVAASRVLVFFLADMAHEPYHDSMMKMTMFIDEALLERVMKLTGLKTKTETVEFALRETERKNKLGEFLSRRKKLPASEWKNSVDPRYDLLGLRAAEQPPKYRTKRGSR